MIARMEQRLLIHGNLHVRIESEQVGELADVVINALTLKTFSAEDREIERYDRINEQRGNLFFQSWHRAVRNGWFMQAFCVLLQMIVFVGGNDEEGVVLVDVVLPV